MRTIEQIDQEIILLEKKLSEVKGAETEVYTRIVGYHRAVDNWNKGKKEEYKHRQTFSFDEGKIEEKKLFSKLASDDLSKDETGFIPTNVNAYDKITFYRLFTSQFCRNCPPVKNFIKNLSIVGEEIDVSTDLGINASRKYNVLSTPTVIFFDDANNVISAAYSVEDIKSIFNKEVVMA